MLENPTKTKPVCRNSETLENPERKGSQTVRIRAKFNRNTKILASSEPRANPLSTSQPHYDEPKSWNSKALEMQPKWQTVRNRAGAAYV